MPFLGIPVSSPKSIFEHVKHTRHIYIDTCNHLHTIVYPIRCHIANNYSFTNSNEAIGIEGAFLIFTIEFFGLVSSSCAVNVVPLSVPAS